jgi:hypothetical protein
VDRALLAELFAWQGRQRRAVPSRILRSVMGDPLSASPEVQFPPGGTPILLRGDAYLEISRFISPTNNLAQ